MEQETLITKNMTVGEVIEKYPLAADIMTAHGLHCFGCSVNTSESIEMGAQSHGIPGPEIEIMINEINDVISGKTPAPKHIEHEDHVQGPITITVTPLAAEKVNYYAEQQGKKGYGLRLAVVRGGCSGHMYSMEFEKSKQADDMVVNQHGALLFVDPESAKMVNGVTIDYVESLQGAGFKINNPNQKAGCGCGKSFK